MDEKTPQVGVSWRTIALITAVGSLVSVLVAWTGPPWLHIVLLGSLLSFLTAVVWQAAVKKPSVELSLLETPFYLAHDTEVFDRYRRLAQELCRISARSDHTYRECALEAIDVSVGKIATVADGKIVFEDTEAWRLVYERLLRDTSVTVYRSVALVRNPDYWQDGAGTQSIQLNFELVSQSVIAIERTLILADPLWPSDGELPIESMRPWIHEQSVNGIWIWLVRESALRQEPGLLCDMGIYGFSAVGHQEFDVDHLRTRRFTLDFDLAAIREAEDRWNKINVYAVSYKDLLDQFRLRE